MRKGEELGVRDPLFFLLPEKYFAFFFFSLLRYEVLFEELIPVFFKVTLCYRNFQKYRKIARTM